MSPHRTETRHLEDAASDTQPETDCLLAWRVHLLRREPHRVPTLAAVFFLAAACVWLMFGQLLPVFAALLLLLGATSEFLFPISYRMTTEGVTADALTSHLALRWQGARRCLRHPFGVTLTPLAAPSRLDAFRGVTLRFAPDGEPGDRASVLDAIARCAPALMECPPDLRLCKEGEVGAQPQKRAQQAAPQPLPSPRIGRRSESEGQSGVPAETNQ